MAFLRHISQARATVLVNAPEVIASIVEADLATTPRQRLTKLTDALNDAVEIVRSLQTAIGHEMIPLQPQAAADLCRAVVEDGQ